MKSWTFARVNRVASVDDESVYSPWRRRKKKAIMIMSAVAWSNVEVDRRFATTKVMRLRTCLGIGFTQEARGSFCFQAADMHWIQKSILPVGVRRGPWAPSVPVLNLQPIEP